MPPAGWDARKRGILGGGLLLAVACFVWAYGPTLARLVAAWNSEPDYSHGYLVVPLALYFCWARRDSFPGTTVQLHLGGLLLIAASVFFRYLGAVFFVDAVDGWTIPLYVGGVVWLMAGVRVFMWALPSVAFLALMIPLPFRAETLLSYPLQRVATQVSCWSLQCLGQPALQEGHVILVDDFRFEVAQACSGLRIFMSIAALAFAYIVLVRRDRWQKGLLVLAVVPIAVIANASRIVITALLSQWVSADVSHRFTHDFAGYIMIPYAAALFGLVLLYLSLLYREEPQLTMAGMLQRDGGRV